MINKDSWGVVIQGPRITYGRGPAAIPEGFDSLNVVQANLDLLHELADEVVVSTWLENGFEYPLEGADVVATRLPRCAPDNRRRQFVSVEEGTKRLSKGITHVLKIRTDQQITRELFEWCQKVTATCQDETDGLLDPSGNHLILSDFMKEKPFYVGDFVFAGRRHTVERFVELNLATSKNLHPVNGVDYVLKYLKGIAPEFGALFKPLLPLHLQIELLNRRECIQMWPILRDRYFKVLPREVFLDIHWRGIRMTDLPIGWESFAFDGEEPSWEDSQVKLASAGPYRQYVTRFTNDYRRYLSDYYHCLKTHLP